MGVPGTPGPRPAGLASGEPGGATFTGACTPAGRPGRAGADPGAAENRALAMRASASGSKGAWGATEVIADTVNARPLYL